MPLKIVEIEGTKYGALTEDGNPIYVNDEGEETGYNGEELAARITQVNGESATRRRELKEAKDKLATFEGIEDPEAAKQALETVKNLDDKQLIDAGKAEEVKNAAVAAVEERHAALVKEKYEPLETERDEAVANLHKEMIGGRFARSAFISEKMVVPVPLVEAYFGNHFTIEEGKVVAKYASGEVVYSKKNPGGEPEFDEALQILVEASPYKDQILKGANKSGTGATGSGGTGGTGGGKTMTRAEADRLAKENPQEMAKRMGDGYTVVDEAA